ncbi:unnamed protein product [Rhizoctonia solani]|uniref:Fungal-specific transcription factor domain protein n=1 Tax=Rhizoctonia solani TaxID=456999 RepID=A0A8H3AS43_9AGAM|nr:unnamed protein product [Rhizoctonia solani]
MDKNLKENTLPFVLQSYSQWALASIFEPLKVVHTMRDHVIQQFLSEDARTRIILIANVMSMSAKNPVVDETGASILAHLISSIQENIRSFLAAPPSHILAVDRRNARCVLENSMEVMTLQLFMGPMATGIQIIEDVAPVFRRACPGSPDQPLQLANILLEPELNLRHFVTADILTNILTGRPTCFKYEVAFSGELWERMLQLQGDYGLQCLQGLPDQFIMIFAWIYSLSEIPGASADTSLITWIESEIIQVRAVPGQLEDPALRIGRAAVREGWRSAALIYLYMVLGGADASDPRVVRAVKNFMRLVNGTKPGRIPDTHFSNAMVLIGVAACKERDRSVLRQRILNVPECSVPGTAGHATVLQLEDIWARTKNEGRAAVWADMRIANFRVIGI